VEEREAGEIKEGVKKEGNREKKCLRKGDKSQAMEVERTQ
jgi:hypothetical protein